jgi:hypothetical protein
MEQAGSRSLIRASYAVTFLAWGVLCWPWLLGEVTIPYDAKAHFHAQLQFLANALHTGQSPFWAPNVFGGSPQIADPQSLIFSPALLIAALNPAPSIGTIDVYVLVLLGFASLAILTFFHDQKWHPAGGVVAAIAFSFGASAAWRIQHIGQVKSYALFAISLWLLARAVERRSLAWGFAAGASAGLMVVEPDQVAFLACYLLAGYLFTHIVRSVRPWQELRSVIPPLTAATITGAAIAVIPLAMTYLFIEASSRPQIEFLEAAQGSLHPASLLTGMIGDLFGALDPKVDYWGPYSGAWDATNLTLSQNMSQIYTGGLPILLLLTIGIVRRQAWIGEIRFFSLALVAMVIYALGSFTPIYHVLYDFVPGVRFFRRPADATFMIGGLLAIVGGYLVHRVATGAVPCATSIVHRFEFGIIAATLTAGMIVAYRMGHLVEASRPVSIAIAIMMCSALAVVSMKASSRRRAGVYGLSGVAAVLVADLAHNNGPNDSTALPVANYDFLNPNCRNETLRFLKAKLRYPAGTTRRDRVELVGLGFSWPNLGLIHGFDHVLGYNPLRLDVVTKGIGAGDTIAGWEQRQFTPLFPSYRSALADLLGLRYVATSVPIEKIDKLIRPGEFALIARTKDAYVYENERALPRAMFVGKWETADFELLVETGYWPSFDPRQTVLLEAAPSPVPSPAPSALEALAQSEAVINITTYQNTIVEIDVATSQPGFVVLNDVWHPWWRASVDGEPVEILKANVMFRAVQVPAGRHHIRFEFEPVAGTLAELQSTKPKVDLASRKKNILRRPRA